MKTNVKVGDTIKVIRMNDTNGTDISAQRMAGADGKVWYIDDMGQLHLEGYGLAVIPGVDVFEVLNEA